MKEILEDSLRLYVYFQEGRSARLRSQIVTTKRGGTRYAPSAFTDQGVAMLSGISNSDKAIEVNISFIRAFVLIQSVINHSALNEKLKKLEKKYNKKF